MEVARVMEAKQRKRHRAQQYCYRSQSQWGNVPAGDPL